MKGFTFQWTSYIQYLHMVKVTDLGFVFSLLDIFALSLG